MNTDKSTLPEKIADIPNLHIWLNIHKTLAEVTGVSIGIYDSRLNPVVESPIENKIERLVLGTERGRRIIKEFYKRAAERVLHSKEPLILRSPINQHLFIIPLQMNKNEPLFIIGGHSYSSYKDFSQFVERAQDFGLSSAQIAPLAKEVTFKDHKTIDAAARLIQTITYNILKHSHPQDKQSIDYREKAILGLITELAISPSYEEIFKQVFQAFCILFDVNSMSLMLRENEFFITSYAFGPIKESLKDVRLKIDEPIIQQVIKDKEPLYIEDLHYILEAGFSEKVTSLAIFPIVKDEETIGLITICNTQINEEGRATLFNFIRVFSFTWEYLIMKDDYKRLKKEFLVFTDIHKALGSILDEGKLYDMILEKSTELIKAEQGSIMVLEPEKKELAVKAVKGINKKIAEHLRVKIGEGIAGKVFEESIPLVVKNVEEDPRIVKRNRPRYKTKSFISIPLKVDTRTIGVLSITDKITGEVFSEDDLRLLQSFASYASVAIERTEFFRISEDLRKISITDSLTGLLNRRYFQERLTEEMERSKRHSHPLSLIMIDIDNFKPFNDTWGHVAGDEALKTVAKTIRDAVRTIDVVSRYGGEEFAVILPQTGKGASQIIAERIRSEMEKTIFPHEDMPQGKLTISLGLASFPEDAKDTTELVNSADKALYRAKAMGKNKACLYGQ